MAKTKISNTFVAACPKPVSQIKPHCSMHGLRKAMLCYLAEPPMLCTTQEIMSISNHQNMQDVETRVAKVRKEMLALVI